MFNPGQTKPKDPGYKKLDQAGAFHIKIIHEKKMSI